MVNSHVTLTQIVHFGRVWGLDCIFHLSKHLCDNQRWLLIRAGTSAFWLGLRFFTVGVLWILLLQVGWSFWIEWFVLNHAALLDDLIHVALVNLWVSLITHWCSHVSAAAWQRLAYIFFVMWAWNTGADFGLEGAFDFFLFVYLLSEFVFFYLLLLGITVKLFKVFLLLQDWERRHCPWVQAWGSPLCGDRQAIYFVSLVSLFLDQGRLWFGHIRLECAQWEFTVLLLSPLSSILSLPFFDNLSWWGGKTEAARALT